MVKVRIKLSAIDVSLLGGNPVELFFEELSSSNMYEALKLRVDGIVKKVSRETELYDELMALIEKEITVYETLALNLQSGDAIDAQVITTAVNCSPHVANQIVSVLRGLGWSYVLNYKKWEDYDEVVLYFQVCRAENEYELVLLVKKGMGLK